MKKSGLLFCVILVLAFLFTGCATTNSNNTSDESLSLGAGWTQIKPGFEQIDGYIADCNTTWHCVKIDLSFIQDDSQIKFKTSTKAFSVKAFAKETGATVAINTLPFAIYENSVSSTGIVMAAGQILNAPEKKYCALAFSRNEEGKLTCTILQKQNEDELKNFTYAFGGFYVVLKDGKALEFQKIKRSRSGCGTDDSGRYLYLFATTPRFSLTDRNGLTYEECAGIMKELGCTQAMQFDGGHSTSMVINGKSVEAPLFQRKIAAALGF